MKMVKSVQNPEQCQGLAAGLDQACRSWGCRRCTPNFGISVNPISTGGQILTATLLTGPPRILRPSYGPVDAVGMSLSCM